MEIQRNKGESDVIAAEVELDLALLDLEKYQKGDYPAENTKSEGEMRLKKKDVEAEEAKLEQYKSLLKKGFKTPEDVRIQESELAGKKLRVRQLQAVPRRQGEVRVQAQDRPSSAPRPSRTRRRSSRPRRPPRRRCPRRTADYEAAKATADIEQSSSSRSTSPRRRRRS